MTHESCMICMELMFPGNVGVLPTKNDGYVISKRTKRNLAMCQGCSSACGHIFHRSCLKKWFYSVESNASIGCPLCRRPIFTNHFSAKLLRTRLQLEAPFQNMLHDSLDQAMDTEQSIHNDNQCGNTDNTEPIINSSAHNHSDNNDRECYHCQMVIAMNDANIQDSIGNDYHFHCWVDENQDELHETMERMPDLVMEDVVDEILLERALELHSNGVDITDEYLELIYHTFIDSIVGEIPTMIPNVNVNWWYQKNSSNHSRKRHRRQVEIKRFKTHQQRPLWPGRHRHRVVTCRGR